MNPGYVEASAALPRWGAAVLRPYGDGDSLVKICVATVK